MDKQAFIFSIDPGEHIGYAAVAGTDVLDAGVIIGETELERFSLLQEKLERYSPSIILIENSYKYKKKINHMVQQFSIEEKPCIVLRDAKDVQFRLFGAPFGKYGKDKKRHRHLRNDLVVKAFGQSFEVHANDALLLIIDWNQEQLKS